MLPPRPVLWAVVGILTATAVVWPLEMAPQANPFVLPASVPADFFFAFWMPLAQALSGGAGAARRDGLGAALVAVPWFTARRGDAAPAPSVVEEDICVGCVQCSIDCPYGAITMFARVSRRSDLVARVDPDLCVSCGICAGSCAPMGVGPPGRTGRDQMAAVRAFVAAPAAARGEIVVICCDHGAGEFAADVAAAGGVPYPIDCAGNLHTSVVELLLRGGPAACWCWPVPSAIAGIAKDRAGSATRVHGGREAELQPRVERARVRIVNVDARERGRADRGAARVCRRGRTPRTAGGSRRG